VDGGETRMDSIHEIRCRGCGGQLAPLEEVRAVYRERSDPDGGYRTGEPRWGYTHLGHEPAGSGYRITGRGRLLDLERQRQSRPR
jgi:hypothetical protein